MKVLLIGFLILGCVGIVVAEEAKPKYTLYGITEYFESRFVRQSQRNKTNVLFNTEYKNWQGSIEKRGETPLGSVEFKNEFIYFSAGNRYKPIPGFYILRDEKYYSAFQNPKLGVIPQPLKKSIWLGILPSNWSGGIFVGEDISEKKPSLYFKSPQDIFAYTFSPETNIHFLALNLRNYKIYQNSDVEYSINSQGMGKRENYFGYLNLKVLIPSKGVEGELSSYKETNGNLFATNPDNLSNGKNDKSFYFKLSRFHYDRLETFQNKTESKEERIAGGNSSLFSGVWGAFCFSGRVYQNKIFEKEKEPIVNTNTAIGLSYEYRLKNTEFMFRIEKRRNQDELFEIKYTVRPIPEWKFEISSLFQKDSNQFRSLYSQWSDGENINTILTDRAAALKLKVIGSFIVFNVSGSRKINGAGEIYFANIQFKLEF